jgi:hypothetical protein
MEKKQWAIKVMDGKTQVGWLVVKHATVATYKTRAEAEKEAEWLNDFSKKIKGKTNYLAAKWVPEEGLETEEQTPEKPTAKLTRTWSVPERRTETRLNSDTPASSVGTRSTLEELIGSMGTGGTD